MRIFSAPMFTSFLAGRQLSTAKYMLVHSDNKKTRIILKLTFLLLTTTNKTTVVISSTSKSLCKYTSDVSLLQYWSRHLKTRGLSKPSLPCFAITLSIDRSIVSDVCAPYLMRRQYSGDLGVLNTPRSGVKSTPVHKPLSRTRNIYHNIYYKIITIICFLKTRSLFTGNIP